MSVVNGMAKRRRRHIKTIFSLKKAILEVAWAVEYENFDVNRARCLIDSYRLLAHVMSGAEMDMRLKKLERARYQEDKEESVQ